MYAVEFLPDCDSDPVNVLFSSFLPTVALVNDKKDEESKPAEETAANPAVETPLAA